MENARPDPNVPHPIPGYENEIYVRPSVTDERILVGEYTYIADSDFMRHVTHFYPWSRDRLIIGKYCQIAAGVTFMMGDANHCMSGVSTYPFYTMPMWHAPAPSPEKMPQKGDTVIGNDVWIGENALILPGVHIGDGAIIGANAVVSRDIEPYTVAAGNPARPVKKRFDGELTALLLQWKWWDKPAEEVAELLPLLTLTEPEEVKRKLKEIQ